MGKIKNETFNLHHNILIKNNNTFEEYWDKIKDIIMDRYEEGYAIEGIPMVEINVWNMDPNKKIKITRVAGRNVMTLSDKEVRSSIRKGFFGNKKFYSTTALWSHAQKVGTPGLVQNTGSFSTLCPKGNDTEAIEKNSDSKYAGFITPIKPKKSESKIINITQNDGKPFSSMDIETMCTNNVEVPVCISITTKTTSKIFLIDPVKLLNDLNTAVSDLWDGLFDFILKICNKDVIFVHNLGNFDGFFIYKALSNRFKPEEISCLIDNHNRFIQIIIQIDKFKIVWKDSYRIFPVSLDDLCNILHLPGKISKYNPEFHSLSLFDKPLLLEEFKDYALQDSVSLFSCISKLQEIYFRDYRVDICSILSTSTLSLKIFRSKYLQVNIPILKRRDDTFTRQAYFGGATDYYKLEASNLYYYDVNSNTLFQCVNPCPMS